MRCVYVFVRIETLTQMENPVLPLTDTLDGSQSGEYGWFYKFSEVSSGKTIEIKHLPLVKWDVMSDWSRGDE